MGDLLHIFNIVFKSKAVSLGLLASPLARGPRGGEMAWMLLSILAWLPVIATTSYSEYGHMKMPNYGDPIFDSTKSSLEDYADKILDAPSHLDYNYKEEERGN